MTKCVFFVRHCERAKRAWQSTNLNANLPLDCHEFARLRFANSRNDNALVFNPKPTLLYMQKFPPQKTKISQKISKIPKYTKLTPKNPKNLPKPPQNITQITILPQNLPKNFRPIKSKFPKNFTNFTKIYKFKFSLSKNLYFRAIMTLLNSNYYEGEPMKLVKLSLVAAMAAGTFSALDAKPLEEAIKDVDVSGALRYRFDQASWGKKDYENFGNKGVGESNKPHRFRAFVYPIYQCGRWL